MTDDEYIERVIQRLRDEHYGHKKRLKELENLLVNKDFHRDVSEYITRLNAFLHTFRFGTEKEYDEIIENYHDDIFTNERVVIGSSYGGDDDDDDSFDVASVRGGASRRPREHHIYLYNEERTLVALVSTYAHYDGELNNNRRCDTSEYECFINDMKNKNAPTFFIEKISKWNETLNEVDIEQYLDDYNNLQYCVSPLRNPEYTWGYM
ncbi:hypothetical protein PBCVMA1D_253R [Paramecium bursaria Chlorella virus MA1D]|nr:hypothetical protein PBCVMA1D_253R [Paramecium bursaria Chlorella virus MA1D]